MRIRKELVAQSIQNHKDVWGKFYVYFDGRIQKILVKRKSRMRDGEIRMIFNHKDQTYSVQYDLEKHLLCRQHYFFTRAEPLPSSLMFKNFWYAHAFMLRMKKREPKK